MNSTRRWKRAAAAIAACAVALSACSPAQVEVASTAGSVPDTTAPPPQLTSSTTSIPPPTPPPGRTVESRVVPLPELAVWAFPGPNHYEGDILSFQVPVGGFGRFDLVEATLSVDGEIIAADPVLGGDPLLGDVLIFRNAFDTTNRIGGHWVDVTAMLRPGLEVDVTQRFVVRPSAGRPAQEEDTSWRIETTACCNVTYLVNSAAERDLVHLVSVIDDAAAAVEAHFGLELPRVDFVLIDKLWGNGGYAGAEVVVSYLDRDFSPGRSTTFRQTVLHELAHAVTDQLELSTPWPLIEGVAVQFTKGHFKPEPLGPRARALADGGKLPPLGDLFDNFAELQHETRYAAVGAFTEYLVGEYGLAALLDLYGSDVAAGGSAWLDQAGRATLGVGLEQLQDGFASWVDGFEANEQSLDFALTVALQEARRRFQATYNPYPNYFIYPSVTETGQDALAMRDPTTPRLVAVEALIAYAQDLINAGDLEAASTAVAEVQRIVADGNLGSGLSGEFLAVAEAVAAAGFELVEYVPGAGNPTVIAINDAPDLTLVDLEDRAGEWVVVDSRPAPESLNALGL